LIENRRSAGSSESLEKLADALKISLGDLFDVDPSKEDGSTMVRIWVPENDKTAVEAFLETMSKRRPG